VRHAEIFIRGRAKRQFLMKAGPVVFGLKMPDRFSAKALLFCHRAEQACEANDENADGKTINESEPDLFAGIDRHNRL